MFSGLARVADIVRSAFQYLANPPQLRIARSGSSNSMLGSPPTTPQDYPETSGFAARREREWGHRRHCADANRRPTHAHLHHWQGRSTLCRKAPATVNDGEIAVASNEELQAAPLSAKRRTSATSENKGRWQWQPGSARVSSRRTGFTSGIWRRGKGRHSQGRERLQSAPSRTLIGNTRFFPPAPWALT